MYGERRWLKTGGRSPALCEVAVGEGEEEIKCEEIWP